MQLSDATETTSLDWRRGMSDWKNRNCTVTKTSGATQRQNMRTGSRDIVCDVRISALGGLSIFDRNGMTLGKQP